MAHASAGQGTFARCPHRMGQTAAAGGVHSAPGAGTRIRIRAVPCRAHLPHSRRHGKSLEGTRRLPHRTSPPLLLIDVRSCLAPTRQLFPAGCCAHWSLGVHRGGILCAARTSLGPHRARFSGTYLLRAFLRRPFAQGGETLPAIARVGCSQLGPWRVGDVGVGELILHPREHADEKLAAPERVCTRSFRLLSCTCAHCCRTERAPK